MAVFVYAAVHAMGWVPRAALVVYFVAGTGLLFGLAQIALNFKALRSPESAPVSEASAVRIEFRRTLEIAAWLLALAAGVFLIGFHITMGLFPLLYIRTYGGSWRAGILLAVIAEAFVIGVFDLLLAVLWPKPYLFELLGMNYFV